MMKEYYMDITMEQFKKELKFMDYEELKKVEDILNRCVFKKYDAEKILERLDAVNSEIMELLILLGGEYTTYLIHKNLKKVFKKMYTFQKFGV